MLLIAFASNFNKNSATQSPAAEPFASPADNLLDTSFRGAKTEPETQLVSKTILAVVAKVYLMAISPALGEFWAKVSDEGKFLAVSKNDSLLRVITEARDILVEEKISPKNTAPATKPLKNLLTEFLEELTPKKVELEDQDLGRQNKQAPLILKKLTEELLDEQLKSLVVGAIVQQKQIIENYLSQKEEAVSDKEKRELKIALENVNIYLRGLEDKQVTAVPALASTIVAKESELVLEPFAYSFHDRSTLLSATKVKAQEEKEAQKLARLEAKKLAELQVLRDYLERLEPTARINFASALYKQRSGDSAVLTVITEALGTSRATSSQKDSNEAIALAN